MMNGKERTSGIVGEDTGRRLTCQPLLPGFRHVELGMYVTPTRI